MLQYIKNNKKSWLVSMSKKRILISRILLAIITIIVLMVVFFYKPEPSEEDIKIREDQERIVEYIKEKVELNNNEELRKIEFKEYKKNSSTGTWKFYVILNDKVDVAITLWGTGGMIYIGSFTEGTMKVLDDESKKKSNNNDIEVVYAK